jgi:hypothetical protein
MLFNSSLFLLSLAVLSSSASAVNTVTECWYGQYFEGTTPTMFMKYEAVQPDPPAEALVYECGCVKIKCKESDVTSNTCTAQQFTDGAMYWQYLWSTKSNFEYFALAGVAENVFSCTTNDCNTKAVCEAHVMPVVEPDLSPSVKSCWSGTEEYQMKYAWADLPPAEEGKPYKCEWLGCFSVLFPHLTLN